MRSILKFCFSALLLLCFAGVQAQITYNFPSFNGDVLCTAEDADYVYIGGNFSLGSDYNQTVKGILAASTTGTGLVDNGFPAFNGPVYAVVSDGNGGWFIGGDFTKVGTFTRNRIVHILADKTVDAVWNPSADWYVNSLLLSGTELYVGGYFNNIGGQSRNAVARLSTTGAGAADTWNPDAGSSGNVYSLALSGTDLYIGGSFTTSGGLTRNNIAKISTTGTGATDAAWNPNASSSIVSLALSGTDLYVGGNFTSIGGQSRNYIAKLNTTSSLADATWNPNPGNTINSLALSGTDLYVGGNFTTIGGQTRNRVAKLSTTGTGLADAVWNPNANNGVASVALSGTDLYVSGSFTTIGGQNRNGFAKITTTGTTDATWGSNDYVLSSATRNSILVSGNLVFIGSGGTIFRNPVRSYLVRMSKSTNLIDATWNPGANSSVNSLVVSGTDLYVGGIFTSIGGQTRNRIAKISTATALADATWNPNASNTIYSLALSGTDLYVGGAFFTIGGQSRSYIAKLTTTGTGTADATWNPNSGGSVRCLALSGTDLYVGGDFSTIGGQSRNYIAKLSTTGAGTADGTWNPNSGSAVRCLALSGTDLYLGGDFTIIGGQTRNRIAKLGTTGAGTADATWNPNASGNVFSLALSGTDLYVGGAFTSIGGQFRNYIAKLSSTGTGTADATWNTSATGSSVSSILLSSTNVYMGGLFSAIQGVNAYNFAVVPTSLKISQTISFSSLSTRFFGGSAFTLFATGGASGNPVTFTSSNPSVATVSGNTVTIIGVGITTITASQAGNTTYNAAADVAQILTVNKASQTVTFSLGANGSKSFGDAPFTISATGGASGNPVIFSSSNTSVATVSGNSITIIGLGTTTITASQAGNANYNTAVDVAQTLTVNKGSQTITFSLGANVAKNTGDAPFTLTGTASSGLAPSYTSSNPAVATISGNTVTIVGIGTTTITASQVGNANYNAAVDVNQSLTVSLVTALEALEDTKVLVYPNPATDLLTIDAGDAKDCSIAIINSEGKLVSSGISTQGNGLISVSVAQLPAGIYTLQISKKGETTNKRFVKQ